METHAPRTPWVVQWRLLAVVSPRAEDDMTSLKESRQIVAEVNSSALKLNHQTVVAYDVMEA
ncbi:unnamed protein product, partial [Ceratitis capitata]